MSTADATAADLVIVGGAAYDVPPQDAARVAIALSLANSMTGACWGEQRSTAATLLALHVLDSLTGAASAGVVTGHSVDSISESFASGDPAAWGAALATTRWGRLLVALQAMMPAVPMAVQPASGLSLGVLCL